MMICSGDTVASKYLLTQLGVIELPHIKCFQSRPQHSKNDDNTADSFGGGGAWGRDTSYIWHSTDVRAEWPPFSVLPDI